MLCFSFDKSPMPSMRKESLEEEKIEVQILTPKAVVLRARF
jgi:hypothetical protein